MNKARLLCDTDRALLYEFSKRSLDRLGGRARLLASLPFFPAYYDANIRKEVDKDRLIIEDTAAAFASGRAAGELDLDALFEKTKSVDRAFLENFRVPSFSLSVRYDDIADIRIRRIRRISRTVYDLLGNWPDAASCAAVARGVYTESEFRDVIGDILRLYSEETRALSRSLRLLPPLNMVMVSFSETLYHAMLKAAASMADAYRNAVFGEGLVHDQA